jgi:hypothetical protein
MERSDLSLDMVNNLRGLQVENNLMRNMQLFHQNFNRGPPRPQAGALPTKPG